MSKYFGTRLLTLLPKLVIITIIIFIGIQLLPGDPVTKMIPPDLYSSLDPAQLEDMRTKLGLNDPVFIQYFRWLFNVVKGDFGYSLVSGGSIRSMLAQRLPATFELAVLGLLTSTVIGLLLGFVSALKQNSILDYSNTVFGMIGISVPEFFTGLTLILIFSLKLQWLPTGGRIVYGKEAFFDRIEFLILPVLSLSIVLIAVLMRFTRGSMLDVLNKEYIKTARSKGLSEININVKHGFRNALIPVIVVLVFRIPMLIGGTVIIETVFNYPGMGSMIVSAISGSDMPVVMITCLMVAFAILISSFFLDMLTAILDPRVRFVKH